VSFTSIEKTRILFFLGYSVFEDNGPAMRAINSLDSKEANAGFIIRDQLQKIDDVRTQIHQTMPLAKAIKDGSIELRAHYTLALLQKMGRDYVGQLATFTKISVFSDIFSAGGAARDPESFYSGDPSEPRISGDPTRYKG
jgi:hypothetical protein